MRKFTFALTLALALVACGGDETFTWGKASAELSLSYCEGLARCGFIGDQDGIDICAEHTRWHLCEPDQSCDVEVDEDEWRAAMDPCAAALEAMEPEDDACFYLGFYGFLPEECSATFDLQPDPPADEE